MNVDKEFENLISSIIRGISNFFINLFYGFKSFRSKKFLIGLVVSFIVPFLAYIFKENIKTIQAPMYVKFIIYYFLMVFPIFYIFIFGALKKQSLFRYNEMFLNIGFKDKRGKTPVLVNTFNYGKKIEFIFKSNIGTEQWKKYKNMLETVFDVNIIKIEEGISKKLVHLKCVSMDYKIPDKINWNDDFLSYKDGELVLGEDELNKITFNLNSNPHTLIAGATGSGKSVLIRLLLWQMIRKGAKIYMIDFKGGVEFSKKYDNFGEVILKHEKALELFEFLIQENKKRLEIFRNSEVKNLPEYNKKFNKNLSRICVFIDEVGEMLDKRGVSKELKPIYEKIEGCLSSLARLSRATGINLFLGVQRPDANVITGQIKSNIGVRISGRFADKTASEIILDSGEAANLPDKKGRFIYKEGNKLHIFQAYYFDDEQVQVNNYQKKYNLMMGDTLFKGTLEKENINKEKQVTKTNKIKNSIQLVQNYDKED